MTVEHDGSRAEKDVIPRSERKARGTTTNDDVVGLNGGEYFWSDNRHSESRRGNMVEVEVVQEAL